MRECPHCNYRNNPEHATICVACRLELPRSNPYTPLPTPNQKMVVFDLDKTLYDLTRRERIAKREGHKPGSDAWYNSMNKPQHIPKDTVIPGTLEFARKLEQDGYAIAYLTGRPDTIKAATRQKLKEDGFPIHRFREDLLFLSPTVNSTINSLANYKKGILTRLSNEFDVVFFFDDSPEFREAAKTVKPRIPGIYPSIADYTGEGKSKENPGGIFDSWSRLGGYNYPEDLEEAKAEVQRMANTSSRGGEVIYLAWLADHHLGPGGRTTYSYYHTNKKREADYYGDIGTGWDPNQGTVAVVEQTLTTSGIIVPMPRIQTKKRRYRFRPSNPRMKKYSDDQPSVFPGQTISGGMYDIFKEAENAPTEYGFEDLYYEIQGGGSGIDVFVEDGARYRQIGTLKEFRKLGRSNPSHPADDILPIYAGTPTSKYTNKGMITAEIQIGRNLIKDVGEVVQSIYRGLVGGRTAMAEKRMAMALASMQKELSDRATAKGGNAVANLKVDYEMIPESATLTLIATADAIKMARPKKVRSNPTSELVMVNPAPKPRKKRNKAGNMIKEPVKKYLQRFMGNPQMVEEFPDNAQRFVVGLSYAKKFYGKATVKKHYPEIKKNALPPPPPPAKRRKSPPPPPPPAKRGRSQSREESYAVVEYPHSLGWYEEVPPEAANSTPRYIIDEGPYEDLPLFTNIAYLQGEDGAIYGPASYYFVGGGFVWSVDYDRATLLGPIIHVERDNPPKNNPGVSVADAKKMYKQFHQKNPSKVEKKTMNIGETWIGLGKAWSIGYRSGKETGDENQKYIHNFGVDEETGKKFKEPDLFYVPGEGDSDDLLIVTGGDWYIDVDADGKVSWIYI